MTQIKAGDRALIGYFSGIDEGYWGKECTLIGIIDNIYKVEIDGKIIECSKRDLDEIPLTDPELKPGIRVKISDDESIFNGQVGTLHTIRKSIDGYWIVYFGEENIGMFRPDQLEPLPFTPSLLVTSPETNTKEDQAFYDKALLVAFESIMKAYYHTQAPDAEGTAKYAHEHAKELLLIRNQNLVK